jgi:hypothetical protein
MTTAEQAAPAPAETSPIAEAEPQASADADPTTDLDAPADPDAELDEVEPDTDETPDEPERRKPRSRYQRLKDRADRLERELSDLRTRTAPPPGLAEIEAAITALAGSPPSAADYADADAYHQGLAAHAQARRVAEAEVAAELQQIVAVEAEQALRRQVGDHLDRVDAFRAETPDFDAVVAAAAGRVEARADIEELIVSSDQSGRLLYHLLKNPALVDRLNALPPREAAREIGRIEHGLTRSQTTRATRAPSPFAALRGGAAPSADPARMEMEEYVRWRKSQRT